MTLLDAFRGYAWVHFISLVSEVEVAGLSVAHKLVNAFNLKLINPKFINHNTVMRSSSDSECEYVKGDFLNWMERHDVAYHVATAYSPESNGSTQRLKEHCWI